MDSEWRKEVALLQEQSRILAILEKAVRCSGMSIAAGLKRRNIRW